MRTAILVKKNGLPSFVVDSTEQLDEWLRRDPHLSWSYLPLNPTDEKAYKVEAVIQPNGTIRWNAHWDCIPEDREVGKMYYHDSPKPSGWQWYIKADNSTFAIEVAKTMLTDGIIGGIWK